eukprot:161000_1
MAQQLRAANDSENDSLLHTATTSSLKVDNHGWNHLLFVDQHQISLCLCAYCNSICSNASELGCDHDYDDIRLYCKGCLSLVIEHSDGNCPLNLHSNPSISSNRAIQRQIAKSIVICPYSSIYKMRRKAQNNNGDHAEMIDTLGNRSDEKEGQPPNVSDDGCNWKGTLKDLIDNHMVECTKVNNPLLVAQTRVKELNNKYLELHQQNHEITRSFESKVEQLQDTLEKTKGVLNSKDKEIQSLKERMNMLLLQQNDDQLENKQDEESADDCTNHTILTDSSGTVELLQGEVTGHSGQITCIATVPGNPDILVSGSRDYSVFVWDINTNHANPGTVRARLQGHTHWITDVDVSSDGKYIISSSFDGSLKLWDIATSVCQHTIMAHKNGVSAVRFSADDQLIISGGKDRRLKIWRRCGKLQKSFALDCDVSYISCSPDFSNYPELFFVTGDSNKTLNVWRYQGTDVYHSTSLRQRKAQKITGCTISPDGSLCATVNENGYIYLWDTSLGPYEARFLLFLKHEFESECNDVVFSPGRYWLCVATGDSIAVINLETKEFIANLSCDRNLIATCTCVRWREDGDILFSGYDDWKIRIWKVHSENSRH